MLRSYLLAALATATLISGAGSAFAGQWICTDSVAFPADSETITPTNAWSTYTSANHGYCWWLSADGITGNATLTDTRHLTSSDNHIFTDTIDGDPIKNITETITNDSGVDWIGYDISVVMSPASTAAGVTIAFGPVASSIGAFGDTPVLSPVVNPSDLTYSGVSTSSPLLAAADVTLKYSFIINAPAGYHGPITYTVTELPITASGDAPEPASLGLLGLGAVALLRRRK